MKTVIGNMILKIIFLVSSLSSAAYCACDHDFEIVCYWSSWSYYRVREGHFNTGHIDPKLCTTIIYAFFGLDENLNLNHLDSWLDNDLHAIANITALKQSNPCLKVDLAVGGWNDGSIRYSKVAAFEDSRKEFARSVLKVLSHYGFDGIDLDWEYPTTRGGVSKDKENFVALLKEIKTAISPVDLRLSIAVPVDEETIMNAYDIPNIAKIVNRVHLMAYDYVTQVSGVTGLSAPLSGIKKTVSYWIAQGLSPRQIIVGIPIYARTYILEDMNKHGIGDPATAAEKGIFTGGDGFLAYYEVLELKKHLEFVEVQTDGTIYSTYQKQWFTYENEKTAALKAKWIKEANYGGAMIWSIDTDDFRGLYGKKYPLLNAINDILNKN